MSERVADERWFKILTVVDQSTREYLCLLPDQSLTCRKVAQASELVAGQRGTRARSPSTRAVNLPVVSWAPDPIATGFSSPSFD